jgi:rhamnogalacturonyl hydrolase YesR
MAIARGVVQGWLAVEEFASVAIQGWRALETQIEPDGTVHNICEGTMCSEDVTFYMERPFYDNDTHGLFAVLFAGLEMQKLFASLPQKTGEDHRKPSLFAGSERARISCAA